MLALIAALTLVSPAPAACRWFSRSERRCRDDDMEIVGQWDPRPAPADWPSSYYVVPPEWSAYPAEKRPDPDP